MNLLCEFFQLNRQIKKLQHHMKYSKSETYDEASLFHIIGAYSTELEELRFVFDYYFAYDSKTSFDIPGNLSKFFKLKELSLEYLCIENGMVKDLLELLPNLNKLHVEKMYFWLCPRDPFTKDDILEVVGIPNKPTYLSLQRQKKFILNINDFEMILKTVKNRNDGTNLTIKIGKQCKLDVSDDIIERNQQWLCIENSEDECDDNINHSCCLP